MVQGVACPNPRESGNEEARSIGSRGATQRSGTQRSNRRVSAPRTARAMHFVSQLVQESRCLLRCGRAAPATFVYSLRRVQTAWPNAFLATATCLASCLTARLTACLAAGLCALFPGSLAARDWLYSAGRARAHFDFIPPLQELRHLLALSRQASSSAQPSQAARLPSEPLGLSQPCASCPWCRGFTVPSEPRSGRDFVHPHPSSFPFALQRLRPGCKVFDNFDVLWR